MNKKLFGALAILLIYSLTKVSAQVVDEAAGKTYYYYDTSTRKNVKEIYHHRMVVRIIPDKGNYGSYKDTVTFEKHGPYTLYDESGNLICSGYFHDEKKDSVWKFYNPTGRMIKTERWRKGFELR